MTDDKVKARELYVFPNELGDFILSCVFGKERRDSFNSSYGPAHEEDRFIDYKSYLALHSELEAKKTELSEVHKYINSCKKLLPKKDSEILAVICHDAANQISELTKERDGLRAALEEIYKMSTQDGLRHNFQIKYAEISKKALGEK